MSVCETICSPKYAHPMYTADECLCTAAYVDEEEGGRCQRIALREFREYRPCASRPAACAVPRCPPTLKHFRDGRLFVPTCTK